MGLLLHGHGPVKRQNTFGLIQTFLMWVQAHEGNPVSDQGIFILVMLTFMQKYYSVDKHAILQSNTASNTQLAQSYT